MARSTPSVTWVRAFDAGARHLGFGLAAGQPGLTQSAVSQQVKAMETRFGAALCTRKPRVPALTGAGRKLLPQVARGLEVLQAVTPSLDGASQQEMLTIACSVSVAQWVIAPGLAAFRHDHPGLRLRLVNAAWPDGCRTAVADVDIRFGARRRMGRSAPPLESTELIALKTPGQWRDLRSQPLIECLGTSVGRDTFFATHDPGALRPALYVDSQGQALQLAVQGNGVVLVSAVLAREALATGAPVHAHPACSPAREGCFVTTRQDSDAARSFRDWLIARLA